MFLFDFFSAMVRTMRSLFASSVELNRYVAAANPKFRTGGDDSPSAVGMLPFSQG